MIRTQRGSSPPIPVSDRRTKMEEEMTNELTLLREEQEGMNRLRLNLIRDKNKLWEWMEFS